MSQFTADSPDSCATTDSFAPYGIPDGTDLIAVAGRSLDARSASITVTPEVIGAVENAFRSAFLAKSSGERLPPVVVAALDDAAVSVADRFSDEPVQLHPTLLTAFYRDFAGYHCAYQTATQPDFDGFETTE
jgi:hypothetical protein